MNIGQLECFQSLANTLNYMKTADQLGLTQPAVTKQIQALEEELGARLFHRTTRSVSLTAVGAQFLPDANAMLSTYYRSREWISSYERKERSALQIGYADPNCLALVRRVLQTTAEAFPMITPKLNVDQLDSNLSHLAAGQLDIVVGMRDARFKDEQVQFHTLKEDRFVVVMHKDYPLAQDLDAAGKQKVKTADLWEYRQIIDIPPYLLKQYFSRGRTLVPVNDALPNIMVDNANEAYNLMMAGLGWAFIPEHLAIPTPMLRFYPWEESQAAPFGYYARKESLQEKDTVLGAFVSALEAYAFPKIC